MLRLHLIFMLLLAVALSACATRDVSEFTEDEVLQQTVLPKHADFENPGLLQRLISGDRHTDREKAAAAEARIARLEQELQRAQLERETQTAAPLAPVQPRPGQLLQKAGLVFADGISLALRSKLEQALLASGMDYPLAVASATELGQQLSAYGCNAARLAGCAQQLVAYPGVQYVVTVSRFELSTEQAVAEVQLHDLLQGVAKPAMLVELPAVKGGISQRALRGLTDKLMSDILQAARTVAWSTRAFDHDGHEVYLSAGQRSGLQPGMTLAVHSPGRLVRSPTGSVAGWLPGPIKGELLVKQLFGDDYAIAELTEGQPPAPTDPILKARAEQAD